MLVSPPVAVADSLPHIELNGSFGPDTQATWRSSSGAGTGSDFQSTDSMRLNIAEFAPMPSASDSTATAVNVGDWRSRRMA